MEDIAALSDKLDRTWVINQLRDVSVPRHHRRLCWTFLSQCGTASDTSLFDESLRSRRIDATFDPGMDAAIACFIALGGEQGLTRIEQDYLANPDAEYLDSFAAISAIRVHGTDLNFLPRDRLAAALRHVLSRPALADLVIADLARWEDWSAMDRVVELFVGATEETRFVKPAAVLYLKNCPLPAAAEALDRLRAIDPKAVQLAESSMMFYPGLATVLSLHQTMKMLWEAWQNPPRHALRKDHGQPPQIESGRTNCARATTNPQILTANMVSFTRAAGRAAAALLRRDR